MKRIFYLLVLFLAVSCTKEPEVMTGDIMGVVTESGSGTTLLSGVTVSIVSNGKSTTTGSNGQFLFAALEPKTYSLQFVKDGYVSDTRYVTVIAGEEAKCDMQLVPEKNDANIKITPTSLNFGITQTQLSITITNNGNTETEWTLDLGGVSWLEADQISGRIASKKTQSVVFKVDREKLGKVESVIVKLYAFGNSYPISVSCAPENAKSDMYVSPLTLNFSDVALELPLTITNRGTAELNWTLTDLSVSYISVPEKQGTIVPGGNKILQVKLNREMIPDEVNTNFVISDGIKQEAVTVKAIRAKAVMSVSPLLLDFGENKKELSFNIANTGNKELNWTIASLDESCLSVSPVSGRVPAQGYTQVNVTLNRTAMPQTLNTGIRISDGEHWETINVVGAKGNEVADVVVSEGLYTYYKFDDNYNDATENGIHGFGSNSPSFVTGVTADSKAVKFSRTDGSSFVVPKPIIDSRNMTVSFWGKGFSDGNIFYMVSSIQNTPMFTLSMSGGSLKFVVSRYNNVYQYSNSGTFTHPALMDNQWHHIALVSDYELTTYSTVTTILYVDGQAVDVVTEEANHFSENGGSQSSYGTGIKFVMGGSVKLNSTTTLNATNMSIDNLRVYDNRRLSANEIKNIYNAKQ